VILFAKVIITELQAQYPFQLSQIYFSVPFDSRQ